MMMNDQKMVHGTGPGMNQSLFKIHFLQQALRKWTGFIWRQEITLLVSRVAVIEEYDHTTFCL